MWKALITRYPLRVEQKIELVQLKTKFSFIGSSTRLGYRSRCNKKVPYFHALS